MRATPYMSSPALVQFLKLGILASEVDGEAEVTKKSAKTEQEKKWAQKFKTCATYLENIIQERISALDPKQIAGIQRRKAHTKLLLFTTDQLRAEVNKPNENVTITYDDMATLCELAFMTCNVCPQGEFVKGCRYREMFHHIGAPVGREEVKEGQCEWCVRDEPKLYMPQGHTVQAARAKLDNDDREFLA